MARINPQNPAQLNAARPPASYHPPLARPSTRPQSSPPTPTSPDVFLVFFNPKPHMFVHSFHRHPSEERIFREARHLWAALEADGIRYTVGELPACACEVSPERGRV